MTEDPRISEIRAVVADVDAIHPLDFRSIPSVGSVVDRIRAILDRPAPVLNPWQAEARIQEQRATSLGYCEHVVETYPDDEEDTCSNLRLHGQVHCAEHTPVPRVFFPGDTVPADVPLMSVPDTIEGPVVALSEPDGVARRLPKGWGPALEISIPSREEWQAAVDRARGERAAAEWSHTDGTNP